MLIYWNAFYWFKICHLFPSLVGSWVMEDLIWIPSKDWLEQFELITNALSWSTQAKPVNLITRLQGQTFSFLRSCTMEQHTNYLLLVVELEKRYVHLWHCLLYQVVYFMIINKICQNQLTHMLRSPVLYFIKLIPVYTSKQEKQRHLDKQY